MKKLLILLFLFFFLLSFVIAADSSLSEDEKKAILDDLNNGKITSGKINVLFGQSAKTMSLSDQKAILDSIKNLDADKQKSFWKSFWKLPAKSMSGFVNSFNAESKNEFLQSLGDQYIKNPSRKNPILKINLDGKVDVGFLKTKSGSEYLKLGEKFIFLDKFKSFDKEFPSLTTFDYNSETDELNIKSPSNSKLIKGGKYIVGYGSFYLLDKNGKIDKSHSLSGAEFYTGHFEVDLTGEKPKLKISREQFGYDSSGKPKYDDGGLKTSNGDYLGSLKDSDKIAEIEFDNEGKIKSVMNSEIAPKDGPIFKTEDTKARYIDDVGNLLGEDGKIDKKKMEEFLKEGGKESEYGGYLVFDSDSGENGKPFVAAVTEGSGIGEIGEARRNFFESESYKFVRELFDLDKKSSSERPGSLVLSSLSASRLEELEQSLSDVEKSFSGEQNPVVSNLLNVVLTKPEQQLLRSPEFFKELKDSVGYFREKLKENPSYFDYNLGEDPSEEAILKMYNDRNTDLSKIFGIVNKADAVLGGSTPKTTVHLGGAEIGTLVVGGSVQVENGGLNIREGFDGVNFNSDYFMTSVLGVGTSIDKLYSTNSDNVWKISTNADGKLEPTMIELSPSVRLSTMDVSAVITEEKAGWGGWFHDVFLAREENHITGRVLNPASLSFEVSSAEAKRMAESTTALQYYDTKGDYELALTFHAKVDPSGKSESERINAQGQTQVAQSLAQTRTQINQLIDVLNTNTKYDPLAKEKALYSLVQSQSSQSSSTSPTYASNLATDLVMNMPLQGRLQLGVEFASQGYTSYESVRDKNLQKVSDALRFVEGSLAQAQNSFSSGTTTDVRAISLVRRGSEVFLKNSAGDIYAIESEVEPILAKVIPLVTSSVIYKKTQNQVLNARNYKFIRKSSLIIEEN